jgi:hypothetical protein
MLYSFSRLELIYERYTIMKNLLIEKSVPYTDAEKRQILFLLDIFVGMDQA